MVTAALFVMIGAEPKTHWLRNCLPLDESGFVVTGLDEDGLPLSLPYVTCKPGIVALGDVRAGSVKRVASGSRPGPSRPRLPRGTVTISL